MPRANDWFQLRKNSAFAGRSENPDTFLAIDEALEDYRAAVALQPRVIRYRKRLAERLWQSDQFFQSLNEWRTLKSQAPRDVDVRLALARGLEKIGQPGDAYREYREVLQLQPEQPDADRAVARLEGRRRS